MMVLESGLDEPQARHYSCRQMTRVSNIDVFSQLEPFAKLQNQILF